MQKSLHDAAAEAGRRTEGPVGVLTLRVREIAARLRCTEGQVYSMAIGLTLSTVLAVVGGVSFADAPVASAAPGAVATPVDPGTVLPDESVPPPAADPVLTPDDPVVPPVIPPFTDPPPSGLPPVLPPSTPSGPDSPPPTEEPTQEPTEEPTPEPVDDITVPKAAWYSATGSADTVPDNTLPVAAVLGQTRNLSVLTLEGSAAELVLQETADSQTSPETAAMKLCPLAQGETYKQATGQTLVDAPAYDCKAGIDGVRDASGQWTFEVSLGKKTRDFALVPQAATPLVAFTVYLEPAPADLF